MVFISKLTVNESRAIDVIQKAQYEQQKAQDSKGKPVYTDMQNEVNRMIEKDSKLRGRFKKW